MKKLNILFLEDEIMDAALIKKVLERSGMVFTSTVVSTKKDFLTTITDHAFDIILADNSLPQFDATEALQATRQQGLNIPFILVTGTVSEEFAVNIMKAGAADYILKDRLQRLPSAITSALSKHALEVLQQKNIDELIKNEAMMKKSEQLAHFGSWEADMLENTVRWSDETYRILDYEPGEVTPSLANFLARVHPDDREATRLMIADTIDHMTMVKFKCRALTKNGSVRNLDNEVFVIRDNNGKATRLNGLARDITETSHVLEQLTKSDANLRTVFEHADKGYVLLDTSWNIVSFNEPARQFSEKVMRSPFEKGSNLLDFLHEAKKENVKNSLQKAAKGISSRYETNYPDANGAEIWYSISCAPVLDNAKKVLGIVVSARDITQKKLLELQEKKITADLMQRNSDLEQFAYIVSHNLRGPVATILGISELVNDKNLVEEEKNYFMEGLITSVKKLDDVIIDLNHIIHSKSNINEKREHIKFAQLVGDVTMSLKGVSEDLPLNIVPDFGEVDEMYTIKSYMHSIFYNLISNSIKYKRPNEPAVIEIKSHIADGKIALHFKDNGMGIDMKRKGDQLFGLYKRFHAGVAEGKGIGLFMVKTQVETLGGSITVHSEVDKGTEFVIEFDCDPQGC